MGKARRGKPVKSKKFTHDVAVANETFVLNPADKKAEDLIDPIKDENEDEEMNVSSEYKSKDISTKEPNDSGSDFEHAKKKYKGTDKIKVTKEESEDEEMIEKDNSSEMNDEKVDRFHDESHDGSENGSDNGSKDDSKYNSKDDSEDYSGDDSENEPVVKYTDKTKRNTIESKIKNTSAKTKKTTSKVPVKSSKLPEEKEAPSRKNIEKSPKKTSVKPDTVKIATLKLILEGLKVCDERKGVSLQRLKKFIIERDPSRDSARLVPNIKKAIEKGIEDDLIFRPKGSEDKNGVAGRFKISKNAGSASAKISKSTENADSKKSKMTKPEKKLTKTLTKPENKIKAKSVKEKTKVSSKSETAEPKIKVGTKNLVKSKVPPRKSPKFHRRKSKSGDFLLKGGPKLKMGKMKQLKKSKSLEAIPKKVSKSKKE